jgi:hypothetical protein
VTHHLVGLEKNHAQIVAKISMLDRIIAAARSQYRRTSAGRTGKNGW